MTSRLSPETTSPVLHGDQLERTSRAHWIELSDLNWPLVFLLTSVAGLVSTSTVYTTGLAERNNTPYFYPLIWEMTGYWTAFLLLPILVLLFSRIPIRRQTWFWAVPAHLALSMAFGIIHTLMMYATRVGLYGLLDLGVYDYGQMSYRFVMEYHKQFLLYWGVYVVLVALAHYRESRYRERQAAVLELRTSELQKQLAQTQLEALRTQLNPHFLFNTLNMVSSVMYEDVDRADQMLAALSRMLRMSLEPNAQSRVAVRRELEFVQCALELTRARFQQRVQIVVKAEPETMDALMPNLLLYTFIENSIKHHDFDREPQIRIEAKAQRKANRLELEVLDNGPGIADQEKAFGRGVGLSNTRARLIALYGDDHRFELINLSEGGLRAHISIPFQAALKDNAMPAGKQPSAAVPGLLEASVSPSQ